MTVAYRNLRNLARGFERIFKSAVCAGIVGDRAHSRRGGYHIGRRFQPRSNFSVTRPDDRAPHGPSNGASAVDMGMNRRDMMLATARLRKVYANPRDPRRKYLNAFNGWDGSGSATRFDIYARRTKRATPDHKSHVHLEVRRRYITSSVAVAAILSALRGDSVATWLRSRGVTAKAAPKPAAKPGAKVTVVKAPPYPGHPLRRNDKATRADPAVKAFQARMRARGWTSIGKADGLPGARFEDVVKRWQKVCKIPPDGVVGPRTWPTPWTRPLGGG